MPSCFCLQYPAPGLLLEVVAAVLEEVGVGRVAVRLSPTQPGAFDFFGAGDVRGPGEAYPSEHGTGPANVRGFWGDQ